MKLASVMMMAMANLAVLAGCELEAPPVTVVVYPSTGRCAVMQMEQEQPVECRDLGNYLREVRKLDVTHQIDVSLPGIETVSKEDRSIDLIADSLRKAGYRNVRTARFGL